MQTVTSCYGFTINFVEGIDSALDYEKVKTSCEKLMENATKSFRKLGDKENKRILVPVKLNTNGDLNYKLIVGLDNNEFALRIFSGNKVYDNVNLSDFSVEAIEDASDALSSRCEQFVNQIIAGRECPKLNDLETAWDKQKEYDFER